MLPALLLSACATPSAPPATVLVTSTQYVPPAPEHSSLIDATVANVTHTLGGAIGIAVDGDEAGGFVAPSPAWSTIKVPIAIAALNIAPEVYPDAVAAITVSDNDAAQRLYAIAGPESVDNVLAAAGIGVGVNTAPLRPEFSTFGQTELSVAQEAQLAGSLACVEGSGPVIALMGQVDPGQAYGLGAVPGALFKGGWGPDPAGAYHVRQFGLLPRSGGYAAVALSALPGDGSYSTGQTMLTQAALALAERAEELPLARCQPQLGG